MSRLPMRPVAIGEWYMVRDAVFASARPEGKIERSRPGAQVLCVGCLEARLGRTLTKGDFADVPTNWDGGEYRSARLRNRLWGFDENEPAP